MTLLLFTLQRAHYRWCLPFSLPMRLLRVNVLLEATEGLLLEGLHQAHNFVEVLRERQLWEAQGVEDVIS